MLNQRRRGVTLAEMIVAAGILAILGALMLANPAVDQARIDRVARTLDELADACCRTVGRGGESSFRQTVQAYPFKLSQLSIDVAPPSPPVTELNSCGSTFILGGTRKWSGPYHYRFTPPEGFKLAEGFVASDTLVRIPAVAANPNAPGFLTIVIPNVEQADARALSIRLTGRDDGQAGAIRFTLPPGSDAPVTVSYYINVVGC